MTAVEDAPAASATAATGVPVSEEVARQQAIQWANGQAARLTERVMSDPPQAGGRANGTTTNLVQAGVFASPAAVITPVIFLLPTPNLGPDPSLYEANVTVYVDVPAQPFAAFATSFFDIDSDPGFPFFPPIPPQNPGYRYELPNRYLVFP
jgi:hypothetical protein